MLAGFCLYLEHPLIEMVIRTYVFFNFANKDIFCWVPSHIGIKNNEKTDSVAKSALDLLRFKVVYPILVLNNILTNIFFPLGKMIEVVLSRTSLILSNQSRLIGSPPTDSAGRMKLSSVVLASVIPI